MFKNHPKGLYALALANTGERFGYYTMLAIFVLFLQAKFGLSATVTGQLFGGFLAAVYFLPVLGGIIADKVWGYGKTVTVGIIVMFIGYVLMAVPGMGMPVLIAALFIIALGTGLFKGNLQVLVGNLYDDPKYKERRDPGFSLFYMAINVGAMFAPRAAKEVVNYFMAKAGLHYVADIPALAHQHLKGSITSEGSAKLTQLMSEQGAQFTDLTAFSNQYIDNLSASYNYGFGVACISLIVSMAIYLSTRKLYKHADNNAKQLAAKNASAGVSNEPELTARQTKERVVALGLVFAVVIFFWMSFHQNGLTMTYFARDYTQSLVQGWTRIGCDVINLALICVGIYALFSIFQSKSLNGKSISGLVLVAVVALIAWNYGSMDEAIKIQPSDFQQYNPFFVVALTPFSIAIFAWLAKIKKEPSTPRKIGYGMLVAAAGFAILAIGSFALKSPAELKTVGGVSDILLDPNWLIGTYLTLTFAELLLSPMGISFVTKVAPPKYKGLMMGGWFAATAIGNYLTSVIAAIWESSIPLWAVWGVLIVCCLLSAIFLFAVMKKLENATSGS
ncbi:MAG: peptide MFS transporter [Dysgonamonadaceae bacterium]|jgi:POT family proton-dependent oligopeptide transporter|nr:peptide MFS transporter [Dysgonamonadaceae bacterium]